MQMMIALAAFLMLAFSVPVQAQSHSAEDEAACTPDVFRLCSELIPNRTAITACLVKRKRQLSPACHKVFSRPSSQRVAQERPRTLKDHSPLD